MGKGHRRKRQRQLDMTVAAIQGQYGPWALVKGDRSRVAGSTAVAHIPTGFPALDRALGIGGLPKGRVCELMGPATSGKTTLALKFLVQAQASGMQVGYVDQALYFDPDYAYRCGLDLSRLLVGRPQDVKEAVAMTEALAHSSSLAALAFDTLDFTWTDPSAAALLAATFERLTTALARSGTTLIVLHELPVGNAAHSPSGGSPALSALAHVAAIRLGVVREQWIHQGRDIRGYEARVEVLKNRLGPAGQTVSLAIKFNGTVQGNGL